MKYRVDKYGNEISVLGYGCMRFSQKAGKKFKNTKCVKKVYYGKTQEQNETITVMETNIDDCTGEILGYTLEKLFENGALDVFYTPIFMKKIDQLTV